MDDNSNDPWEQGRKVLHEVADTKKSPGDPTKHDMNWNKPSDHISRKVYMFPESFNALRKELEEHYPTYWGPMGFGYHMATNAQLFIQRMDELFDMVTQFDSGNVDGICKRYLDACRKARGLGPLHSPSEYFHNQEMENQVRLARQMNELAPFTPIRKPS